MRPESVNPPLSVSRRVKSLAGRASLFLLIGLACAGAVSLSGQVKPKTDDQQAVRPQKPLEHEVSVVLKLIQVSVLDSKDKPVSDLTRDDFVITDNGRPLTISAFERHTLAAAPKPVETKLLPTPLAPNPVMARKFFLFLDFAFNNARGVIKAKEAALGFLDANVLPGDQVGLLSYSLLKGLKIHEFLTVDHAKVRQAVEAINVKSSAGRAEDVEEEYWRRAQEAGATDRGAIYESNKDLQMEGSRYDSKNAARSFILNLTNLARAIRYVPGRKNIVLFSTGIANSLIYGNQVGEGGTFTAPRKRFDPGDFVLRTENEEMLKELSSSNCTFFTFDTRESAKVSSMFDYDAQTFEDRSRDIFSSGGVRTNTTNVYKDEKVTGQYALVRMSTTTGGKYFSNINEFKTNLDDLQNLTGTYYVLGFSVNEQWDGRYHEIKVEVGRKDCVVRAQSGYYSPKPFVEFSELEKRLHLFDLALSDNPLFQTPLAATTLALAGGEDAGSSANLVLLTRLPADAPEKLGGAKVEIVTFIFDPSDALADLRRTEDSLARFKGRSVYYASGAKLAPGSYKCRVVVRDLETGQAAVASTQVVIPPPLQTGIRLHPPLVLAQADREAYIEGREKKAEGAPPEDPTLGWAINYPFEAKMQAPLLGALSAGTESVDVILPCSIYGIANARVALKIAVLDDVTSKKVPLKISPKGQTLQGNTLINIFEIPTAQLAPGSYTLTFEAEEPTTKAASSVKTTLVIK